MILPMVQCLESPDIIKLCLVVPSFLSRQKKFQAIILMIEPQTRVYNMLGQKFYFSGLRARDLVTRGTLCQNTSPPIMEGDRTNITVELCYS